MTRAEGGKQYVYDAWGRLSIAKDSGGSALVSYRYDGLNRRIREQPSSGTARDLYYSDRWQIIEEREAGIPKSQYVWSVQHIDALVLRDRDADAYGSLEQRLYVLQEGNHTITSIVSATGSALERYVYEPYGSFAIRTPTWAARQSSSYGWIYLHQGGRYDTATGLYHFRHRDYVPTLGRWMQPDPAGSPDGLNTYAYVKSDPIDLIDPWGLATMYTAASVGPCRFTGNATGKSYIAWIGRNHGFGPGGPLAGNPLINGLTVPSDATGEAMAHMSDLMFNENPTTPAVDQQYRLFSSVDFVWDCCGNEIKFKDKDKTVLSDQGYEFGVLPAGGGLIGPTVTKKDAKTYSFRWEVRGQPHPMAEWGFGFVALLRNRWRRRSRVIWHVIWGEFSCKNKVGYIWADIGGSKFPSHRLWVMGAVEKTLNQGPFANLFVSHPQQPDLIQ
jgi:RHS repeat-associated protein